MSCRIHWVNRNVLLPLAAVSLMGLVAFADDVCFHQDCLVATTSSKAQAEADWGNVVFDPKADATVTELLDILRLVLTNEFTITDLKRTSAWRHFRVER